MRSVLAAILMGTLLLASPSTQTKKKATTSKTSKSKKKTAKAVPRQTVPDAKRSREIQDALQKAGYLKTEPSGKWDAATTEALTRYQKDNGFSATGKPDAHSLIKLGLGPKHE